MGAMDGLGAPLEPEHPGHTARADRAPTVERKARRRMTVSMEFLRKRWMCQVSVVDGLGSVLLVVDGGVVGGVGADGAGPGEESSQEVAA